MHQTFRIIGRLLAGFALLAFLSVLALALSAFIVYALAGLP
jgi:hypothetical protein